VEWVAVVRFDMSKSLPPLRVSSEWARLQVEAWLQNGSGTSNPENVAREKEEMEAKIQEVKTEMEPRNAKIEGIQAKINDIEDKIFANLSEKVILSRQKLCPYNPPSPSSHQAHASFRTLMAITPLHHRYQCEPI
jgi:hypothetical protein